MIESYIYILKLVTGEEVIGTSECKMTQHVDYINLSNVYVIETKYSHDHPNAKTYLSPFMVYSGENLFTFPSKSYILYTTPSKEMIGYYLEFVDDVAEAKRKFSQKNPRQLTQ